MKKWLGLFLTQFLGVFNDHLLKFLAILVGTTWINPDYRSTINSVAAALLVIPYILFSPYAGKLAKIKYKKKILIFLKLMEIPIMILASVGFYLGFMGYHYISIAILLLSILLMGLQSCIYSPSKYGLIRDVDGVKGINYGTGMMEMLGFVGILLGTYVASRISTIDNKLLVFSGLLIFVAITGWLTSFKVAVKETVPETENNDSINPIKFIVENYKFSQKIEGLNFVIIGLSCFWFVASLIQMNMLVYVQDVYNGSDIAVGNAMASAALGIGIGCWLVGRISKRPEYSLVVVGAIGMIISSLTIYFWTYSLNTFYILIFLTAFFCGIYKVPLNTYIQDKVKGRKLGDIIAYNNLITFVFIIFATLFNVLVERAFSSREIFLLCAVSIIIVFVLIIIKIPTILPDFIAKIFYVLSYFLYKIKVEGEENIKVDNGALLVSNHISLIDFVLLVRPIKRSFSFVIDYDFFKMPPLGWLFKRTKMIPISAKWRTNLLKKFYEDCSEIINDNGTLCIFPEGELTRIGNLQTFKKGYENIKNINNAPIIPMYVDNALGTHFTQVAGATAFTKLVIKRKNQKVSIKIGEPMPSNTKAFVLRQRLKELESEIFCNRVAQKDNILKLFKKRMSKMNFYISEDKIISGKKFYKEIRILANSLYAELIDDEVVAISTDNKYLEFKLYAALMYLNKKIINISTFSSDDINVIIDNSGVEKVLGDKIPKSLIHIDVNKVRVKNILTSLATAKILRSIQKSASFIIFYNRVNGKLKPFELTYEYAITMVEGVKQQFYFDKNDTLFYRESNQDPTGFVFNLCLPFITGLSISFYDNDKCNVLYHNKLNIEDIKKYRYVYSGDFYLKADNIYHYSQFIGLAPIASINAPNFEGRSAAGQRMSQKAYNPETYGRVLPGTTVKIVDENKKELESNEEGVIYVKNSCITDMRKFEGNGWFNTNLKGKLDEGGFLTLSNDNIH